MFTITGMIFYIIVYHYTEYVTLEFDLIVSETDCKTFTMGPEKKRAQTGMNDSLSYTFAVTSVLPTDGSCFRIQVIQGDIQFYDFVFDATFPAYVWLHRLALAASWSQNYNTDDSTPVYIVHGYTNCNLSVKKESELFTWFRGCIGLQKQFRVDYISKWWYVHIEIKRMPCEVPCLLLGNGKNSYVKTCDICENYYIFHQRLVYFKSNRLLKSRMVCNECMDPVLRISFFVKPVCVKFVCPMVFRFYIHDNMTMYIPPFKEDTLIRGRTKMCCAQVPVSSIGIIHDETYRYDIWRKPDLPCNNRNVRKGWNGYWYHMIHSNRYVSWYEAATACRSLYGSLLTIHSQIEYEFVQKIFCWVVVLGFSTLIWSVR